MIDNTNESDKRIDAITKSDQPDESFAAVHIYERLETAKIFCADVFEEGYPSAVIVSVFEALCREAELCRKARLEREAAAEEYGMLSKTD